MVVNQVNLNGPKFTFAVLTGLVLDHIATLRAAGIKTKRLNVNKGTLAATFGLNKAEAPVIVPVEQLAL